MRSDLQGKLLSCQTHLQHRSLMHHRICTSHDTMVPWLSARQSPGCWLQNNGNLSRRLSEVVLSFLLSGTPQWRVPLRAKFFFGNPKTFRWIQKLGDKPLEFALPPFPLPCACPTHKPKCPFQIDFNTNQIKRIQKNIWKSAVCFGKSPRCWTIVITYYIKSIPMKFACRPLFLFLVPVVACRRESLKAWRLSPCVRASNLGHCSCCSWKSEKIWWKMWRNLADRFIQLSSNYLSTSSKASHLRQGSRNPGTAACLPACDQATSNLR